MKITPLLLFLPVAFGGTIRGQTSPGKNKTPFTYEVNVGGMGALGKTSADYSNSFLIGGGASVPVSRWANIDFANLDFGFGTTGASRVVSVTDGTTRSTNNYQIMVASGGRVNVPLGGRAAIGLGGGYGAVVQNEYVPTRVYYQGGVQITETVSCSPCSRQTFSGFFLQARLLARSTKHNAFGITGRYFEAKDSGAFSIPLPPQRWLTVSFTFSFGI